MKKSSFITSSGMKLDYIANVGDNNYCGKRALIVYLHGVDGCTDTLETLLNIESLPNYVETKKIQLPKDVMVVSPQCHEGMNWSILTQEVIELIDYFVQKEIVDEERIVLTGASLGGMGTLDIAIKYPEKFSCIVPVCAKVDAKKCAVLTNTPVWFFHGELDISMGFSVVEANAIINLNGGNSKLTLLPQEGHEIRWIYHSSKFDVMEWMLSKNNKKKYSLNGR